MGSDVKQYAVDQLKDLTEPLSKDQKVKTRSYWFGMNKFYEQILDDEFKKNLYSYNAISGMISNYDSITQQFFLLLSVKNNYHLIEDKSAGMDQIIEHISFNEFKPWLEKYKQRNSSSGYINEDIGNCILYDHNMKQINFNELLQKSSQKYVYFDFCGSWCKPCIEEIKEYSISKKFDNSTTIKPIWLFFENNKKDWFRIIDKYNLKKENCFLLENDSTIQKNFGLLLSWQGEFPHHFLFTNQGKIINSNAEPLAFFDDTDLVK